MPHHKRVYVSLLLVAVLAGCASAPPQPAPAYRSVSVEPEDARSTSKSAPSGRTAGSDAGSSEHEQAQRGADSPKDAPQSAAAAEPDDAPANAPEVTAVFVAPPSGDAPDSAHHVAGPPTFASPKLRAAALPQAAGGPADEVLALVAGMSVEEKVAQLLIIAIRRDTRGRPILQADAAVLDQVRRLAPGGVILFGENVQTIPQTMGLIRDLQAEAAVPLFVAVDEEGGTVSRLRKANAMHATPLPPNHALSVGGTPHMAFTMGSIIGEELSALGFNMNLAPVADVVPPNGQSFIGRRSFGSDPALVAEMVSAFTRGLQSHDVCAVLKHFPGHGDTEQDTHTGAVVVPHGLDRLRSVEFLPFIHGIEAGADGVMTAHLQVPAVTGNDLPATFSPVVQKAILRGELGHDKLIVTDAMNMGAIQQFFSPEEAALNAFRAGADLLLMPPDPDAARDAILAAVREDSGLMAQLDASVARVLRVKYQRGILAGDRPRRDPETVLGSPKHRREARAIIDQLSSN